MADFSSGVWWGIPQPLLVRSQLSESFNGFGSTSLQPSTSSSRSRGESQPNFSLSSDLRQSASKRSALKSKDTIDSSDDDDDDDGILKDLLKKHQMVRLLPSLSSKSPNSRLEISRLLDDTDDENGEHNHPSATSVRKNFTNQRNIRG